MNRTHPSPDETGAQRGSLHREEICRAGSQSLAAPLCRRSDRAVAFDARPFNVPCRVRKSAHPEAT